MKIAIAGAGGRMGRTLIEAVLADRELSLAAALEVAGSPAVGAELGGIKVSADPSVISKSDVLIDFTRPEGTLAHLKHAKACVIGTTGFDKQQLPARWHRLGVEWNRHLQPGEQHGPRVI